MDKKDYDVLSWNFDGDIAHLEIKGKAEGVEKILETIINEGYWRHLI